MPFEDSQVLLYCQGQYISHENHYLGTHFTKE